MRASEMQTLEIVASAPTFGLLPQQPTSRRYFGTSVGYVAQFLLLLALAKLPFSLVAPVLQPVDVRDSVHLVAPDFVRPPSKAQPTAVQKPVSAPKTTVAPKLEVRLPQEKQPAIQPPKQEIETAKISPPKLPVPVVNTDNVRNPELLPGP